MTSPSHFLTQKLTFCNQAKVRPDAKRDSAFSSEYPVRSVIMCGVH